MPTFKIACSWEVCGETVIEADTFENAWKKAMVTQEDVPLPTNTSYIDGSFMLDREMSETLNNVGL